ncbi:MAG: spore coat protein [Clostridia bacterium]|nr:spore coat protein [Clostridia bacterium]
MQLSQKECSFLKELKEQEKLCIAKYQRAAACAVDGQLKGMFADLAAKEQQHLASIEQMEQGTVNVPAAGNETIPTFTKVYTDVSSPDKENDKYLCTDALAGEKHVSALYDTSVFEFKDDNARKMLNHIQSEEQNHGKTIYNYMSANCMYN